MTTRSTRKGWGRSVTWRTVIEARAAAEVRAAAEDAPVAVVQRATGRYGIGGVGRVIFIAQPT